MFPRSQEKELLDVTKPPLNELREALRHIEKTNRLFLNSWLIYRFTKKLIGAQQNASILDIGTGGGDIPKYLVEKFKSRGQKVTAVGIDINPDVLIVARETNAGVKEVTILEKPLAEIADEEFSVAVMSQMLHHLSPEEAVDMLKTALSKVRQGIIISDFIRTKLNYYLTKWVIAWTKPNKFNSSDGPLSILRSYTDSEIAEIFKSAGIKNYRIHNFIVRKIVVVYK